MQIRHVLTSVGPRTWKQTSPCITAHKQPLERVIRSRRLDFAIGTKNQSGRNGGASFAPGTAAVDFPLECGGSLPHLDRLGVSRGHPNHCQRI